MDQSVRLPNNWFMRKVQLITAVAPIIGHAMLVAEIGMEMGRVGSASLILGGFTLFAIVNHGSVQYRVRSVYWSRADVFGMLVEMRLKIFKTFVQRLLTSEYAND